MDFRGRMVWVHWSWPVYFACFAGMLVVWELDLGIWVAFALFGVGAAALVAGSPTFRRRR